jgi:dipeptidyl aminopeptidase/acylaminoacyl peptidase
MASVRCGITARLWYIQLMPTLIAEPAAVASTDPLTVERILGFDPAREYRLDPRQRFVAYTQEAAGARQLFSLPLRGGPVVQLTASEKSISDPQWSPDGRRLAFIRDGSVWVIDADGSRQVRVTEHPAGNRDPRWSPDSGRLAFLSRRRGWSQVWLIDAPIPRRGRPASHPKPAEATPLTPTGVDVDDFCWAPDGTRLALVTQRESDDWRSTVSILDVTTGAERRIEAHGAWECGPRWLPDGGLLLVSDADGWFQVVRLGPDLSERTILTSGAQEHGEPSGGFGAVALPSPDGRWFAHIAVHDGAVDLLVAPLDGAGPPGRRPRGRRPKNLQPVAATPHGEAIQPWPGVWRAIGWSGDGSQVVAIGESERHPQDLWFLPVPGVAGDRGRPRALTESLPSVLRHTRWSEPERIRFNARDGLPIEAALWRPTGVTGRRDADRVPAIVYTHGGPTWQNARTWQPFKQLLVRQGFAVLDVDFRGSTGYGRAFREANRGEWGHADAFDCIDAAHWLVDQPWCDGRLAVYGGSYGGYLTLCCLVEEPALWQAGIDLYGDSEIAESYRHGDRPGRIDLHRQMGSPDDPANAPLFRRGSPLYRAERIEAPLLVLHGRKDRRVVPLMSEKLLEALVIEDKHHEIRWYDEEGHGWEQRANRRDAYDRILAFLKLHVRTEPAVG